MHDPARDDATAAAVIVDEPIVRPRVKSRKKPKRKQQPPYNVVLHNDDFNSFGYVVSVLCKVLRMSVATSFCKTMDAHLGGRSVVWQGVLEVAELKAEQIRGCGPDPQAHASAKLPLKVTVEPQSDPS